MDNMLDLIEPIKCLFSTHSILDQQNIIALNNVFVSYTIFSKTTLAIIYKFLINFKCKISGPKIKKSHDELINMNFQHEIFWAPWNDNSIDETLEKSIKVDIANE